MITLRRQPAEVTVILHDPLEEVNGQQRAFSAYGQEGGAGGGWLFGDCDIGRERT